MKNIINKYKKQGYLTERDIEVLKEKGIVNWLGWKGTPLMPILEKIMDLPYFDSDRYKNLFENIDRIACYRDIDFHIWKTYLDFTKSNLIFSYRLYKLLWWTKWYKRLGIAIITMIVLQKYWKQYFRWFNK